MMKAGENGIAGGITGTLTGNGTIHIAYCASASIEAKTVGAICGQNEAAASQSDEGAISDTYYLNTLSGGEEQGTAKEKDEMRSDAFKDELNALTEGKEGLCSWTRSDSKNSRYPRLLSSLVVETELTNADKGLTVKGLMHKEAQLQLTELDKKNEVYQDFQKYVKDSDRQILYCGEPALVYEDGQPAAYEEILKLKLDLSKYRGKDYKVLVYRNNKVEELAINQIVQHALLLNCVPVSGDGPASYMGAPAWTRGDLGKDALKQLEAQGEADIQISLQAAASTAQRAVEVAAMLQQGAKQLQAILGQDVRYKPYLSRIAEEEMR